MRHIPLKSQTPDATWVTKAQSLLDKLVAEPDVAKRNEIIDAHSAVWGKLKQWLLGMSHDKCWFSEAKDCFSHWDVEHYRPKKIPKDGFDPNIHHAYWWLAFDWTNFRVCGNAGNRKKGAAFPLRTGCTRCAPLGDLRSEIAMLLDPAEEDDPVLLSFNMVGEAIPAAHVTDAWERSRVTYSVDRYNLDFPPLVDKRKTVWAECWNRIQEYQRELSLYKKDPTNAVARIGVKQAAKSIREMMTPEKELSSVARACVASSGDPRITAFLQTN